MVRTRIVGTIGPSSREPERLYQLITAGLDVARLNFSHGDRAFHGENIQRIRAASEKARKPVAIMADLQGPKLRVGEIARDGLSIRAGEQIILTTRQVAGHRTDSGATKAVIPVSYERLADDVAPGERVLIDDGLMEVVIDQIDGTEITCTVVTGGVVHNHKGLNLPGTTLSLPSITPKDWEDLDFMIAHRVDWVALSFVRAAREVLDLKEYIAAHCPADRRLLVIAKIEKPQALNHIEDILQAADGVMVARGDLGIEIPAEKLPIVQKRLIRQANGAGKPVITATQMLESMIRNPRPTRAEASDVANAILDGTDAIMLSGETAVGKYPVEAVKTMVRIAQEVEAAGLQGAWKSPQHIDHLPNDVTDAVSHATCETACDLQASAIIASTASGRTARNIAKYRPHTPIIAVTPSPVVQRQLMLSWGVIPLTSTQTEHTDEILRRSLKAARESGLVQTGDRVVVTAGVSMPGTTNLMTVEVIGES
jgi:pyruvate kinase